MSTNEVMASLSKLRHSTEYQHIDDVNHELDLVTMKVRAIIAENIEIRAIMQDFLATKEYRETWIAEMRGTIDAVLNGEQNDRYQYLLIRKLPLKRKLRFTWKLPLRWKLQLTRKLLLRRKLPLKRKFPLTRKLPLKRKLLLRRNV